MNISFSAIVCFIIILMIISVFTHIIKLKTSNNSKLYPHDYIRGKLKTGDIILFSAQIYDSKLKEITYTARTSFLGANYGHLGIIYRDGDDIYVVESTNINHIGDDVAFRFNNYKKGGIRIINYDILMQKYSAKHKGIFSVKFLDKPIPNDKFLKKLVKYKKVIFPNTIKLVCLLIIDVFISKYFAKFISSKIIKDKNMMCSEFVHSMLQDCGVLSYYPSKLFWPFKIATQDFKNIQKIRYSKPYRFSIG